MLWIGVECGGDVLVVYGASGMDCPAAGNVSVAGCVAISCGAGVLLWGVWMVDMGAAIWRTSNVERQAGVRLEIVVANVVGCAALQLGLARAFVLFPCRWFERDGFWGREHTGERFLYRRVLRVTTWKRLLPDGATWIGSSFLKRRPSRDAVYLRRFLVETRRAEAAHWAMILCMPVMFAWNPAWACATLMGYAVAANAPCIVVQRHNRFVLLRVVSK